MNAEYFESGGDFAKMNAFVPEKLTRRMIVSKRAALYDSMGKLEPVKGNAGSSPAGKELREEALANGPAKPDLGGREPW